MSATVNRPRVKTENEVWDVNTLTWVAMTQPATSGGGGGSGDGAILDGANPTLKATVLTGSTQAVNTDKPLVVAFHPSSQLPSGNQIIGTVKQGAGGSVSNAWRVSHHPFNWFNGNTANGPLSFVGEQLGLAIEPAGSAVYLEVFGTYTGASLKFTVVANDQEVPIFGVRTDTGLAETSCVLLDNSTVSWKFFVPGYGSDSALPALLVTVVTLATGTIGAFAAESALPHDPIGATSIIGPLPSYTTNLDFVSGANPIYIGLAAPSSATSAAVWQIRKLTYDGSSNLTNIQYAAGTTAFSSIWDNRASLSYS